MTSSEPVHPAATFVAGSAPELLPFKAHPFIPAGLEWRRSGSLFCADLAIPPDLSANLHAVIPSFAMRCEGVWGWCALLEAQAGAKRAASSLRAVGEFPAHLAPQGTAGEAGITSAVDTFEIRDRFERVTLRLCVHAPDLESLHVPWVASAACLESRVLQAAFPASAGGRRELQVPAKSQMQTPEIGKRIWSPTRVARLAEYYGGTADPSEIAACAYCAAEDLYGVWPWNIYAAARRGVLGFLACFDAWESAARLLDRGIPLVASIRYAKGELGGAALERESAKPLGHLVVLRGYDGGRVLVNDPAAASREEVPRAYKLNEFLHVWLTRAALAYVLLPPPGSALHSG